MQAGHSGRPDTARSCNQVARSITGTHSLDAPPCSLQRQAGVNVRQARLLPSFCPFHRFSDKVHPMQTNFATTHSILCCTTRSFSSSSQSSPLCSDSAASRELLRTLRKSVSSSSWCWLWSRCLRAESQQLKRRRKRSGAGFAVRTAPGTGSPARDRCRLAAAAARVYCFP